MNDLSIGNFNEKEQLNALIKIASLLNRYGFKWSLGASMMLKLRGLDVSVDDLDIIIQTDEIKRLEKIISIYNFKKEVSSDKYRTTHFYELNIDNVDIDIMIGFKISTDGSLYTFDDSSSTDEIKIQGVTIYLSSLEEWLKAYKAMNRKDKISVIENHLNENSMN